MALVRQVLAEMGFLEETWKEEYRVQQWFDKAFQEQRHWFAENYPSLTIRSSNIDLYFRGFHAKTYRWYVDFDDVDTWMHYQLIYGTRSDSNS